jgi:hypothetical protein
MISGKWYMATSHFERATTLTQRYATSPERFHPLGAIPDGQPLRNYWGYSTVGFFSPEDGYCIEPGGGQQLREFRDMVKTLHRANIEVILDVVFNHTDEGNEDGPVFSFKGFANEVRPRSLPTCPAGPRQGRALLFASTGRPDMKTLYTVLTVLAAFVVWSRAQAQDGQARIAERIQDLELTDDQEAKIAAIRKDYQPKVAREAKALAALVKEEVSMFRGVLTEQQ